MFTVRRNVFGGGGGVMPAALEDGEAPRVEAVAADRIVDAAEVTGDVQLSRMSSLPMSKPLRVGRAERIAAGEPKLGPPRLEDAVLVEGDDADGPRGVVRVRGARCP